MFLTFKQLEVTNRERCEASFHPLADWSPTDWGCALGGECGEALNLIKKLRRATGTTNQDTLAALRSQIATGDSAELVRRIGEELADVVIYADLLASRLRLSLEDCVIAKFNKTSEEIGSPKRL